MDATELTYPVFEANQVLNSTHLNGLFRYLDEQTRLTRANLIGIGIACGLEVSVTASSAAGSAVGLSKGCGVTSQGYLVIEPADLALTHVRAYTVPPDPGYAPFTDAAANPPKQFDVWELLPSDSPDIDAHDVHPLDAGGPALADKAVVLFLELNRGQLRNCGPNNCDDRGAETTATVRRLLVTVTDLDRIIAATSQPTLTDLGADLTERLALPDLRMPRINVPNTGPVSPQAVLRAFQNTFRADGLAARTATALSALYQAFQPLVGDLYPSDPFSGFGDRFRFLDTDPVTPAQVRFLPYYWDLFDDLFAAYDEVRWKGLDLYCACCPDEGLFPQHLMAGVLVPANFPGPKPDAADYRHRFLHSPATGDCADRTREVRTLFRRLVEMVTCFTETAPTDQGIRATPSRWGDAPLAVKAIPYYYDQSGTPPLYELWDPVKTARGRANQSLGYRAAGFQPPPPTFVTEPLRFDLEPNDFLRIEGHLGRTVQDVLESLLMLTKSHRLPIEVIALRTGTFDENVEIDLGRETCRFRDLETLYGTLRSELICFLVKEVQYFYALPGPNADGARPIVPGLWLLKTFAPDFRAQPGTVGHLVESIPSWRPGAGAIPPEVFAHAVATTLAGQAYQLVWAMSNLGGQFAEDLRQVDFAAVGNLYPQLVEVALRMDELRRSGTFDGPGLSDRLDDIVFRCRLDPFEAIAAEYRRRVRDAKQASYLGHFLERHPGVQHKAGVPLGGTFVLVYHELPRQPTHTDPQASPGPRVDGGVGTVGGGVGLTDVIPLDEHRSKLLSAVLGRLPYKAQLAEDPDLRLLYQLTTGTVLVPRPPVSSTAEEVYLDAIAGIPDGTVIADFFLPYACCSDCPPIEYQLPPARLRVSTTQTCTGADGSAEVTVTATGASGSPSVQVDGGAFHELGGALLLGVGNHTIVVRDAAGTESSPVTVAIPPRLVFGDSQRTIDHGAGTYRIVATLHGGTPPYTADIGIVANAVYTSPAAALADPLTVTVTDAAGCTTEGRFESGEKPCTLPCQGAALRAGYLFWLPTPSETLPISEFVAEVHAFVIAGAEGGPVDVTDRVSAILAPQPGPIDPAGVTKLIQRWLGTINKVVAATVTSDQWVHLEYEPPPNPGTTGTLFIDRLDCLDVRIVLTVSFRQGERRRKFEITYSSDGTSITEPPSSLTIPPFHRSTSNKCPPGTPQVPVCERTDLTLDIRRTGAHPDTVELSAVVTDGEDPVAFLWEVADGVPPLAGGARASRVSLRFEPVEPVVKAVRLTAYTERGCTVTVNHDFNIVRADG